eukprot:2277908-Rhodomonas_salina.1
MICRRRVSFAGTFKCPPSPLARSVPSTSWLRVANSFGQTAQCSLRRGVKQGDVTSPLLFAALFNLLLRSLQDSGAGYVCHPPQGFDTELTVSNGAFVDDTFCTAQSAGAMQTLVDRVAAFSTWTGIHVQVHVQKPEITAFDFGVRVPLETDGIRYLGASFAKLAPDKPFKFLGVRLTLTGDWRYEKRYIW